MPVSKNLIEIYNTSNGCVYQCDRTSRFVIDFAGHMTPYNVPCLFALKRKIDLIDISEMLNSTERSSDVEIICPCGSERVYVLSALQVAEFKELLDGAKSMLQLHSVIREALRPQLV